MGWPHCRAKNHCSGAIVQLLCNQKCDSFQTVVAAVGSRPGKPTDNAYVESFNDTLQSECLNAYWFTSLADAKQIIEAWRREYNDGRPHRAHRERTSNEIAT